MQRAACSKEQNVTFINGAEAGGIWDFMTIMKNIYKLTPEANGQIVPCKRLDNILKAVNIQNIDMWSLDVEGGEYEVLKAINFKQTPVHVIVIERNPNDRKIERLLLAEEFLYVREQRGNRVWVNPQYERQMADRG